MRGLVRIYVVIALAACIAGCVTEPYTAPSAVATSLRKQAIPAARIKDAVVIGKSTKADVIAAFGETLIITFDTGYEIWVYRLANAPTAEFVILFTPAGVAAKTRIRPAL